MRIPNATNAIIAPEKLRDYLLNPNHRRGGSKARLLLALGYRRDNWKRLEDDLRTQHLSLDSAVESTNEYGHRYEIIATIQTPNARQLIFLSIWQIDCGTDVARFITMYPR